VDVGALLPRYLGALFRVADKSLGDTPAHSGHRAFLVRVVGGGAFGDEERTCSSAKTDSPTPAIWHRRYHHLPFHPYQSGMLVSLPSSAA
jgi:hypothetical protein